MSGDRAGYLTYQLTVYKGSLAVLHKYLSQHSHIKYCIAIAFIFAEKSMIYVRVMLFFFFVVVLGQD